MFILSPPLPIQQAASSMTLLLAPCLKVAQSPSRKLFSMSWHTQKLFRKNDSAFNEAFASTIGEQGTRLWLKQEHPQKVNLYKSYIKKRWQFFNLLISTRQELEDIYKTKKTNIGRKEGKRQTFKNLKRKYARLKKSWGGDKRFDNWFKSSPVNNAKLAVIGVYYQKVPEFTQKLKSLNYDFEKFYTFYSAKNKH